MKGFFLLAFCSFTLYVSSQAIDRNDVVIDEIMADSSPPGGLPEHEFVELRNVSGKTIDLKGWKFSDGSNSATIAGNYLLLPDSLVILCATNAVAALSIYGHCLGLSNFPSLNNDGDSIYLQSFDGKAIHSIIYTNDWYHNSVKSVGA